MAKFDTSLVSAKRQEAINALSKEELLFELERGSSSRFARSLPYLKVRLAELETEKQAAHRSQDVSLVTEANQIAAEANQISRRANSLSKISLSVAIVAVIVAAAALLAECHSG